MSKGKRFTRRRFLGASLTGAAAVVAACKDSGSPAASGPAADAGAAPGSATAAKAAEPAGSGPLLKIVHWKHFVPDYDKYFDKFAQKFGQDHNCRVQVDYVATPDLPTAIAADISRGSGHDIFHLNGTGAWLYDQVLVDVTDVADKLAKEFDGFIPGSESIGKVKDKWLAIPHWFIRYPMIINRGYFQKVGADYTDKTTWADLLKAGEKLKKAGYPFGIPYSQTPDANDDLIPLMNAYGAYMFDKDGNIDFQKKEIIEVLNYGKDFYNKTMTDEVLSWDDSSNNRFIASGKGSMICNPISAYRTAAKDNPEVYRNLEIQLPPIGPKGRVAGARTMSYGIYNFSKNQELAKQFLYTMNKEGRAGMEASTGYNHPFLKALLKKPMPVIGQEPKLMIEQDFHQYVKFVGYPGPMTKTATTMYAKFVVPSMFAEVAKGKAPRAAMEDAEKKLRSI
jgi:multiple sugar transport system substrate-binding protein